MILNEVRHHFRPHQATRPVSGRMRSDLIFKTQPDCRCIHLLSAAFEKHRRCQRGFGAEDQKVNAAQEVRIGFREFADSALWTVPARKSTASK
jgi:hypothetical protein